MDHKLEEMNSKDNNNKITTRYLPLQEKGLAAHIEQIANDYRPSVERWFDNRFKSQLDHKSNTHEPEGFIVRSKMND